MRVGAIGIALSLVCVAGFVAYVLRVESAPASDARVELATGADAHATQSGSAGPVAETTTSASERGRTPELGAQARGVESEDVAHAIRGRVVDGAARPIAGADVLLADAARSSGIPLERLGASGVPVARSITDAEGRFRVARPIAGDVRFCVHAPGFAPSERTIPLGGESATDVGDVALEPGVVLRGRVLDGARRPIAGAKLTRLDVDAAPAVVLGSSDVDVVAVSDDRGAFAIADLAPGVWSLLVTADGRPDALVRGNAEAGRATSDVEIVLDDGLEIRGRVAGAPPEMLTELWIRAVPEPGDPNGVLYGAERADPARFLVRPRGARCAADGSFVVRGLTRELDYRLSGRVGEHDFFSPLRTSTATARAGALDVELAYRGETAITFRVVDGATLAPVTELEVRIGRAVPSPSAADDRDARRTYADGRVRITQGLDGAGDEPLELRVDAIGYRPARIADVRTTPGKELDLGTVRLVPSPVIVVRVVADATGAPVAGARVSLAADPDVAHDAPAQSSRRSAETDADGRARVDALDGTSVRLRVEHPDFAPFRSAEAGSFGGADPARASDEIVRLRAGGTVVVEVRDALGAAVRAMRVRHTSAALDVASDDPRELDRSRTDAEGRLVFAHLAPGEHAFEIAARRSPSDASSSATGTPERRVVVADGGTQTITWILPARARVTGRVTSDARPVSGATLTFAPLGAPSPQGPDAADALDARTNGNGEYARNGVELGSYRVTLVHPSRAMPLEADVVVDALQQTFDVAWPSTSIEGRVVDAEGRPLAGVRVHVERAIGAESPAERGDPRVDPGYVSVASGADGGYALLGVQGDVELVVVAAHPDFQRARSSAVRVATGEHRANVDLALAPGAVLEVCVARAPPTCRVRATHVEDAGATEVARVGANGVARLEGLRPGRWRVRLEGCSDSALGADDASAEQVVEVALHRKNGLRFELP